MWPIEPVQALLGEPSSSSIAAIVTTFGQPVIEPPGKSDARDFPTLVFGLSSPSTPDTKCCTFANASIRHSDQFTLPFLQTEARSCLSKSTNIKCSAISFSEEANSRRKLESSESLFPLGLVPLIGLVETIPDSNLINRSGDAEAIAHP